MVDNPNEGLSIMQISNQKTQIQYEYEHLKERTVTRVLGNRSGGSDESSSIVAETSEKHNERPSISLSLSPDLMLKKKLIESVSGKPMVNYSDILSHKDAMPRNENRFLMSIDQQDAMFFVDGDKVTQESQLSVKEHLYEYERLDFSTEFSIESTDGQNHELSLSLSFSRELDITRDVLMTAAEFKDPLILNMSNSSQLFSDESMSFDLQGDGTKETLPALSSGIWLLARDNNDNARIDHGMELFGASTGNGFAELAEYDSDADGVIDGRDNHFHDLKLWDGKQRLKSIEAGGVSAILLNASDTPFTFTDAIGNPRAQLRQTSVFIDEQNRAGAIHQIDIAV